VELFKSSLAEWRAVQRNHFDDRLEVVRKRFASGLEGKINDTYAELPILPDRGEDAVAAVANAYRRVHGICGVGRALGFPETGRAAKDVEDVLIAAYRAQRGMAAPEMERLKKALDLLAIAAQAELRAMPPASNLGG
jgi:hypothetical protein